jgi:uncharacterized protein (TIGR02300 family)
MPKAELGTKRVCVSCGTRFYDLQKQPAVCPKCGTEQPADQPKPKRGGNVVDLRKPKKAAVAEEADVEVDPEAEAESEEAEDGVLEDTSDLDDDDDAIATDLEVEPDGDEPER